MSNPIKTELFKVYREDDAELPAMFAHLMTTAYSLQAWEYSAPELGIRVEMHFRPEVDSDADLPLEEAIYLTREAAIAELERWGAEIKALEDEAEGCARTNGKAYA